MSDSILVRLWISRGFLFTLEIAHCISMSRDVLSCTAIEGVLPTVFLPKYIDIYFRSRKLHPAQKLYICSWTLYIIWSSIMLGIRLIRVYLWGRSGTVLSAEERAKQRKAYKERNRRATVKQKGWFEKMRFWLPYGWSGWTKLDATSLTHLHGLCLSDGLAWTLSTPQTTVMF